MSVVMALGCCCENVVDTSGFPVLEGPYLGQALPGTQAELFAPGVVTTGMFTRDVSMTPEGDELYFTVAQRGASMIMVSRLVDGRWQEARAASFSGRYRDFEPHVTPDGRRLLFLSNRAPAGQEEKPGWGHQNIWFVERQGDSWGEPELMPPPVTTEGAEFYPSVTNDGTLYFTRGGEGRAAEIYRSAFVDGAYQEAERLGPEVNSVETQYNAFISPDESFLLYGAAGREDSLGGSDCYVSFRDAEDRWSGPFNLGPKVNDEGDCDSATVSPDGSVLFFMSTRKDPAYGETNEGITLGELLARQTDPGNGSADIYWIDAAIIDEARPTD